MVGRNEIYGDTSQMIKCGGQFLKDLGKMLSSMFKVRDGREIVYVFRFIMHKYIKQ